MTYTLEHHKGAFRVDALSGWDLYAAGTATDSKVFVSNEQEFHLQAACKKKSMHGASFHQGGCCTKFIGWQWSKMYYLSLFRVRL